MEYSMVGITALIILLALNKEFIFVRSTRNFSAQNRAYRLFLISMAVFFSSDILWGIFNEHHLITLLYITTVLFFASMSLTLFLWTRYVTIYINGKGIGHNILYFIGLAIFGFVAVMLIINCFKPVLFEFDGDEYIVKDGRTYIMIVQEALFLGTSVIALIEAFLAKNKLMRNRFIVISLFSIALAVAIIFQASFPLLPLYSMGCLIGVCLIFAFIVESEKEEHRKQLQEMLEREIKNERELDSAKQLVNIDPLTGANSKFSYVRMEDEIDKLINAKLITCFAVVVFDVNGLKQVNDTLGHDAGDDYIRACYKLIKDIYTNDTIYRFGGDEFVVVLQDDSYDERYELLYKFESQIEANILNKLPVVSTGMDDFNYETDNTYRAVFTRADDKMYERKKLLKSIEAKEK